LEPGATAGIGAACGVTFVLVSAGPCFEGFEGRPAFCSEYTTKAASIDKARATVAIWTARFMVIENTPTKEKF
jgi:hypothetical protein